MARPRSKSRTSIGVIAIIGVIIIVVAYFGYSFYTQRKAASNESVSTKVEDVKPAPAISTPSDLDEATTTIDQAEIEDNSRDDMTEIENELSAF